MALNVPRFLWKGRIILVQASLGVQMSSQSHVGLGCRCSGSTVHEGVSDMRLKPSWPWLSSSCGATSWGRAGTPGPEPCPGGPGRAERTRRWFHFPCALPGGLPLNRHWKESKDVPAEWVRKSSNFPDEQTGSQRWTEWLRVTQHTSRQCTGAPGAFALSHGYNLLCVPGQVTQPLLSPSFYLCKLKIKLW